MGLSFSVPEGIKVPSSLQNIYKELQQDLGCTIPSNGNLEKWSIQVVLLLHSSFLVPIFSYYISMFEACISSFLHYSLVLPPIFCNFRTYLYVVVLIFAKKNEMLFCPIYTSLLSILVTGDIVKRTSICNFRSQIVHVVIMNFFLRIHLST